MHVSIQKNTVKRMLLRKFSMFAHNRNGFSLAELMVVVAIVGIIAGLGTPVLLSMKAKSLVRADARDVYSTFRHARAEAVKRSASVCVIFDQPATGEYTVFLDDGAGDSTKANNATKDTGEITLSVKRLQPGSSFQNITFTGNLGFNARGLPLGGKLGSVEIHSSALKMQLSLSMAGNIKTTVL